MKVDGLNIRPIWLDKNEQVVHVIDQRLLPHEFVVAELRNVDHVITAIREMFVRGAPLIGVTGAYGVYLAVVTSADNTMSDDDLAEECNRIKAARPTAINLAWAVDRVFASIIGRHGRDRIAAIHRQQRLPHHHRRYKKRLSARYCSAC